ncbi:MAG: FlgD immunoglobulin-like domain containing protein [bacterium]
MSKPSFLRPCIPLALISAALPATALAQWALDGAAVCTATGSQTEPAIATDGADGAIMGWTDHRSGVPRIYAQRVDAAGTPLWTADGVAVCTPVDGQHDVAMLKDFAGGAVLFWSDERSGGAQGLYAQRLAPTGLPVWPFSGVALSTHFGFPYDIVVTSDLSTGHVVPRGFLVAWFEQGLGDDLAIRVQHVDAAAQGLWTAASVGGALMCNTVNATKLDLVMDTDGAPGFSFLTGGAVLAWAESRPSSNDMDIFARRVDAGGTPQWTAGGIDVCAAAGVQRKPAIANVGGDDCIITWQDSRGSTSKIYAQRIDSTGQLFWATDGVVVCPAGGPQTTPAILKDGAGGAFIAWVDARSGQSQVYAQRIGANGSLAWVLIGVPIGTAAAGADGLKLLSDGAGGFFATWRDTRSDSGDIFAQRVDANGNVLWPLTGLPLSQAAGAQLTPAVVAGAGGLIAVWEDNRTGIGADVYANRVTATGGVTAAPIVAVTSSLLSIVSGNPTRGEARFRLALPESRNVSMDVCDVTGRRVRSLASGSAFAPGTHALTWDGANDLGALVPAGVYFVRLIAGNAAEALRVVVVR